MTKELEIVVNIDTLEVEEMVLVETIEDEQVEETPVSEEIPQKSILAAIADAFTKRQYRNQKQKKTRLEIPPNLKYLDDS